MRPFALLLVATTALACPLAANAQSVNEDGADALEAQVPAALDQLLQGAPDVSFAFDGPVQAVPSGDSYSLALPQLTLDFDGQAEMVVPAFTADVAPQANGWQRIAWDLPSPFTVIDPNGREGSVTIAFESGDNAVLFAPEYRVALDAGVSFSSISATIAGEPDTVSADLLEVVSQSFPSDTGVMHAFDSQSSAELSQLTVSAPSQSASVEIGSVAMNGTSARQRLDLFAGLQDALDGVNPDDEEAFFEAFLNAVRLHGDKKWIGEAFYQATVRDVSLQSPDAVGALGLFTFGLEGRDLDEANSDIRLQFAMEDVTSPMLPPMFADIVPTQVALDLAAADAPLEAVAQLLYDAMGEPLHDEPLVGPKGRRAVSSGALRGLESLDPMALLGVVLTSDALVNLNALYVEAPIGYVSAQGSVDPDPAAAFSATGLVSVDVAGMPDMIAFAQSMGGEAAGAAGLASVVMAMGRDGTDEDGVAIKTFDIEVTASGGVTLNGNDLSAMMGMFQ